jgi:hypothetical protein
MGMPDPNQGLRSEMHKRLRERGFTLESWGREHGFVKGLASATISRHIGKNKRPIGWRAKEIIEGLETLTGLKLCG